MLELKLRNLNEETKFVTAIEEFELEYRNWNWHCGIVFNNRYRDRNRGSYISFKTEFEIETECYILLVLQLHVSINRRKTRHYLWHSICAALSLFLQLVIMLVFWLCNGKGVLFWHFLTGGWRMRGENFEWKEICNTVLTISLLNKYFHNDVLLTGGKKYILDFWNWNQHYIILRNKMQWYWVWKHGILVLVLILEPKLKNSITDIDFEIEIEESHK